MAYRSSPSTWTPRSSSCSASATGRSPSCCSGYQFLRQIDGYDIGNIADQLGEPVWQGELAIASDLNREVTTSFPVDEALPDRKPGVYVMTAEPKDDRRDAWESRATQWFVVSDIGLSTYTGQDGLNVFARALGSAKPMSGVDLTLLARNNEILGTAKTDADGRATFNPGLSRGEGGMVPAVLMASSGGEDFVFLDMTRAGFDLSDRGVTGRAAPGALDVYAWTERGIYRAGEDVHVAALARDGSATAVQNLPLTFIFSRPDGVEDRRIVSSGAEAGGHAVDLPLSTAAMRGTWSVAIHTDPDEPAIASQMFLVEDFVPDRIEFDLSSDTDEIAAGETANITVDGRFLYGAPAAGLAIEGEVALSTIREWESFPGYFFGLADEQDVQAERIPLTGLPLVGDDGKAVFPVVIDKLPSTTRLLNAEVIVRMREAGGRAVERSLDIGIRPSGELIAIRPDFSGDEVPAGRHGEVQHHRRRSGRRAPGPGRCRVVPGQGRARLPVVSQRQFLELRAGRLHQGRRQRHDRHFRPAPRSACRSRSTGAATGSKSPPPIPRARSPATSSMPAGTSLPVPPRRRTRSKSPSTRPTTRRARSPS